MICEYWFIFYSNRTEYPLGFSQTNLACSTFLCTSFACGASFTQKKKERKKGCLLQYLSFLVHSVVFPTSLSRHHQGWVCFYHDEPQRLSGELLHGAHVDNVEGGDEYCAKQEFLPHSTLYYSTAWNSRKLVTYMHTHALIFVFSITSPKRSVCSNWNWASKMLSTFFFTRAQTPQWQRSKHFRRCPPARWPLSCTLDHIVTYLYWQRDIG